MDFGESVLVVKLAGLLLGASGAFALGLVISRLCSTGKLTRKIYYSFRYSLKISILGAGLAWSGSLISISWLANVNPQELINPGFWAGVTILSALTFNLYFIRKVVMPMAKQRVGVSIYGGLTEAQQNRMIALGTISTISWITLLVLFALGDVVLGKFGFGYSYGGIVLVYFSSILACVVAARIRGQVARKRFMLKLRERQSYYRQLVNGASIGRYL